MVRAEWLRLRQRRDLWLGLLAVAALAALTFVSGATSGSRGLELGPTAQPAGGRYAFPESITTLIRSTQLLVVAVAAYAAAATIGAEFTYGTIRTSLLARSDRPVFVLIRLLALTGYAALLLIVVMTASTVLPLAAKALGVEVGDSSVGDAHVLGVAGAEMLFAMLTISIATLLSILVRNAAIAILLAAAYGVGEGLVTGIVERALETHVALLDLLPVANMQLLGERALGAPTPSSLPTSLLGFVGVAWIALLWIACVWVLGRMDIVE